MRKAGRWILAAAMTGLVLVGLAGCKEVSEWVDKTVVVTVSLKKNELFKIGNHVMTTEEAKIFLLAQKTEMNQKYTDQIWNTRAGDRTVADYMKEDLEANLAKLMCMVQMAEDQEITLNRTEEENVKKAAETYYYALSEADKQYLQINLTQAETAFRHYYLAEKLTKELTKDVDTEVSDDEARIITIQQIFVTSAETAQTIQERAANGSDFGTLSSNYNESSEFEMRIGRENVSGAFAEAAFALSSGEVSGVVQTDSGYHVIKCINHYNVEETLAHKEEIVQLRRREAFEEAYHAYVSEVKSYYNESAWESITYADDYTPTSRDFFDVYRSYFG